MAFMPSTPSPSTPRGVQKSPLLMLTGRGKALRTALGLCQLQPQVGSPQHVLAHHHVSPDEKKPGCIERRLSGELGERRLSGGSDYNEGHITPDDCEHCNRRCSSIICRACGHTFSGRVRVECPDHPHVIHLMDIECCPNCKAHQLKEFSAGNSLSRTN